MTLDELLLARMGDPCVPLKPATVTHYQRSIRRFGGHLGRTATTDDLNRHAVMAWAQSLVIAGYSPHTANQQIKQVRALWEWGAREGVPGLGLPPKGLKVPAPRLQPLGWTDRELAALMDASARQTGRIGPHWARDFWTAWHWWTWTTGERTAATLHVTLGMLDLAELRAEVPGAIRKGGQVPMRYILTRHCADALQVLAARTLPGEALFCCDGPDNAIHKPYRKLLADAGIPYVRHKTGPQKMRRTVATRIAARGGTAAAWLGHAPRNVAEEHYIDPWPVMLRQHEDGIWPLESFGEPPPKLGIAGALKRWAGVA